MSYEPTKSALDGRELLGRQLRYWRQERGMTQEQLAHNAGFDRSFLVEVENGRHSCTLDRLFDLASALDVDAHLLIAAQGE